MRYRPSALQLALRRVPLIVRIAGTLVLLSLAAIAAGGMS